VVGLTSFLYRQVLAGKEMAYFFNEKLSIPQLVCVIMIVIRIVGLKILENEGI